MQADSFFQYEIFIGYFIFQNTIYNQSTFKRDVWDQEELILVLQIAIKIKTKRFKSNIRPFYELI